MKNALGCAGLAIAILSGAQVRAALPKPLVDLKFPNNDTASISNAGSLGGGATLAQADGLPALTNNVPSGPYAPKANAWALDFGGIAAGQGGRALDLMTDGDGTLGPLDAFTICGWLNARDLNEGWGGNRIAFAMVYGNGPGFDLVQTANGSLRIGINQWPDGANNGGPSSSAGMLKADANAGDTNWVFFAVTYDSSLETSNLKYYFGSGQSLASLDGAHTYKGGIDNGGVLEMTGNLTVGNFGAVIGARTEAGPNGGSRVFRGLMDEFRVFGGALDLAGIQQAQLNGAPPPVAVGIVKQPEAIRTFSGQQATFRVQVSGSAPYTFQWQRDGADIAGATSESYTIPAVAAADNGAKYRVKVGNSLVQNVYSDAVALTVIVEDGRKIALSFSDGGVMSTNTGNLGGNGVFAQADGYPLISDNVPSGAFAPGGNSSSVDMGAIAENQGGRAIDATNSFDNTVGPMKAFTVAGWLNCRDLREGWGGNRIVFALAEPGGAGFDLVQTANGALRLGVNEWPDAGAGGPFSSPGMITEDAGLPADNWVFFAVTYDGESDYGNVKYYFGKGSQAAQLDIEADYAKGVITRTGPVTIGNFSAVASARNEKGLTGSRCFRGLMDEIHVFNKVLAAGEIQALQKTAAYKPATIEPVAFIQQPRDLNLFEGVAAAFQVNAGGTPPLSYQWWQKHAGVESAVQGATSPVYSLANAMLANNGDEFWVVVTNQKGSTNSARATLTVHAENNEKMAVSFSEASGIYTANMGNLAGGGMFAQTDGYPQFSTKTPAGKYAPSNNKSSVDFGPIAEGQGGRAIDFTNTFGNTAGAMTGFTLTGWLNCQDLRVGWGGNRILFGLASPGGPGFDLVQNADGALQLGVNQWPDGSPALSSIGKITEDAGNGDANWVFFAVTYDGSQAVGNVSYYFGTPSEEVALDMTADYDRGPVTVSGSITAGNFGSVVSARNETGLTASRVFRGLMDELHVFNKILTLSEIKSVQKAPVNNPVAKPALKVAGEAGNVVISWESSANFQLQSRSQVEQGEWTDESTNPTMDGNKKTVRLSPAGTARFFRLIER